jgi:hypothetical protein
MAKIRHKKALPPTSSRFIKKYKYDTHAKPGSCQGSATLGVSPIICPVWGGPRTMLTFGYEEIVFLFIFGGYIFSLIAVRFVKACWF